LRDDALRAEVRLDVRFPTLTASVNVSYTTSFLVRAAWTSGLRNLCARLPTEQDVHDAAPQACAQPVRGDLDADAEQHQR
jgi:hypothetical protein